MGCEAGAEMGHLDGCLEPEADVFAHLAGTTAPEIQARKCVREWYGHQHLRSRERNGYRSLARLSLPSAHIAETPHKRHRAQQLPLKRRSSEARSLRYQVEQHPTAPRNSSMLRAGAPSPPAAPASRPYRQPGSGLPGFSWQHNEYIEQWPKQRRCFSRAVRIPRTLFFCVLSQLAHAQAIQLYQSPQPSQWLVPTQQPPLSRVGSARLAKR